jgi:hypothetical protein
VWPASQAPMTGIKVFGGFFYNLKQFDMGFNLNQSQKHTKYCRE